MNHRRPRILIVDDEAADRAPVVRHLSSTFEVLEAESLAEARLLMKRSAPLDIVVTDIRLDESAQDDRGGLILLDEIKSASPRLPVVVMTSYSPTLAIESGRLGGRGDAQALGAVAVLQKPPRMAELEAVVREALAASRVSPTAGLLATARRWLLPGLVLLASLLVWEAVVRAFSVPEYLLPAPTRILEVALANSGSLVKDTSLTLLEAFLGFLLSNVLSLALAIAFCHHRWAERSFYPYMIGLKSVPIIAIAPLLVLWFGYGLLGKIVMAAVISFFPLVVNATVGLKAVDDNSLELMRLLSASRTQVLIKLRLPSALPHIFSALKISSTLAVTGAIVGELTGAKAGIGFVILMASYNIDTPMLFAAIVAASISGLLFFAFVALAEDVVLKRVGMPTLEEGRRHV